MKERIAIVVRSDHQFPLMWSGEGFKALEGKDEIEEFLWVVMEGGFCSDPPDGDGIWICEGDFRVSFYECQSGARLPLIEISKWAWRYPDGYELIQFSLGKNPWEGPVWGAGPPVSDQLSFSLGDPQATIGGGH